MPCTLLDYIGAGFPLRRFRGRELIVSGENSRGRRVLCLSVAGVAFVFEKKVEVRNLGFGGCYAWSTSERILGDPFSRQCEEYSPWGRRGAWLGLSRLVFICLRTPRWRVLNVRSVVRTHRGPDGQNRTQVDSQHYPPVSPSALSHPAFAYSKLSSDLPRNPTHFATMHGSILPLSLAVCLLRQPSSPPYALSPSPSALRVPGPCTPAKLGVRCS